ILPNLRVFPFAEFHRAQGRKIQSVLRSLNGVFGNNIGWQLDAPLFPEEWDVVLPCLAHAANKSVRPSQQQHVWAQRVPASEDGEVLQHNGVEKRGHQFVGRYALLLQAIYIGLSENAALACDRMNPDPLIALVAQLVGRNLQLGVDLVDDRTGAPRALVVHRRDLLPPAVAAILFENDDFGILTAQFDDRVHFRMELLHREGDSVHLLHEFRADQSAECIAAGAGDEHAAVAGSDADFDFHALKKFQELLGLVRVVALVVLPENAVGPRFIDSYFARSDFNDHGLNRGGPDVHAHEIADAKSGALHLSRQRRMPISGAHALCSLTHRISSSSLQPVAQMRFVSGHRCSDAANPSKSDAPLGAGRQMSTHSSACLGSKSGDRSFTTASSDLPRQPGEARIAIHQVANMQNKVGRNPSYASAALN